MAPSPFVAPDVLVLAGGGTVGEAWMHGVLAGLEDATGWDARQTEAFVGTSAGSIVATKLVAGRRSPRPGRDAPADEPEAVDAASEDGAGGSGVRTLARGAARVGWAASAPIAAAALAVGTPAGALARAAVLSRAGGHGRSLGDLRRHIAGWNVRFDGRLRVCTVDRGNGRRVVFGAPGAPPADVAGAVCASCAIPWVFSPVRIGDRDYVDGGAWSVTNLDAARTGRGTQVLCLDPAASLGGTDRRTVALRAAFRLASELELQTLRRRGSTVVHVTPDLAAATSMGTNLLSPHHTAPALAAGYRQGLALAGGRRGGSRRPTASGA
jgi:NTE family protein